MISGSSFIVFKNLKNFLKRTRKCVPYANKKVQIKLNIEPIIWLLKGKVQKKRKFFSRFGLKH